jgi:hypothetical protein
MTQLEGLEDITVIVKRDEMWALDAGFYFYSQT